MGIIQTKWQREQSRTEDGIFFGSDDCLPLEGGMDNGYTVGERCPIADFIASSPDAWCELVETVVSRHEREDLSVHAGETSWEGEGFVAVVTASTGQLLWLLHLSTSEPFVELEMDNDVIHAVSGGYPMRYEWSIPIRAPERFTFESIVDP
ncbi:MAG TPA: hypothetical protein VMP01_20675 [Pirellulaceae bacterium]|nr:hypothetical protein [Pirellulaceae bacterium]